MKTNYSAFETVDQIPNVPDHPRINEPIYVADEEDVAM